MVTTSKWLAIVAVAFVAGSFVASPELQAFAANTVFSSDITDGEVKTADLANNAVTAGKIKDGEVKAAEIATDAVGASELSMVTKLLFGECKLTSTEASNVFPSGATTAIGCAINGVDSDDNALANLAPGASTCFTVITADALTNNVNVYLRNECNSNEIIGQTTIGIIVFDK
jgi:hypothetical protein